MTESEIKRRRVTRACDLCRNKKVKCDGKQPCIHCTVYLYNCTYDQPNIRNKNAQPLQRGSSQILERLSMRGQPSSPAHKLLHVLFPKVDPDHIDVMKFQKIVGHLQQRNPSNINLHELQDLYLDSSTPNALPVDTVELHPSLVDEEPQAAEFRIILPPKPVALQLIYTTWGKACVLFRFYHRPLLLEEVDLLYSLDPLRYTDRQQKFLPFMYSILACGLLFLRAPYSPDSQDNLLEDDGFRYFNEARKLIDITNVTDIPLIQTIVMMIIYLQCSARLSTCYSYIGIALRSALKEGLHRNLLIFQLLKRKLDPIEVDTRKRLFYTIYKMDIYINSLLGLPRLISEDEFDQDLPLELDDELITRDAYLFDQQQGRLSSSACANHHTKLIVILSHIVRELYPIKIKSKLKNPVVSEKLHDKVTVLELELKQWLDALPPELKPTDPLDPESLEKIPEKFLLANYYLHLSFLNCQNNLYRPFIHYILNGYQALNSDPRSLIRGRNCIKVARMVVKLANKMIDQNLLVGTYWFLMYTIFFSIACLIYYFHFANYNNLLTLQGVNYAGVLFDDDLNIEMIRKDIEIGRKVLDTLKNMSPASLRIYNILNKLFEQLNRRTADTSLSGNFINTQSFEANDKNVQMTLMNFDRMNDFRGDAPADYDSSMNNRSSSEETKTNDANSELYDVFTDANPPKNSPPEKPFNNYVPGVIDTVDTQIFGRILPPYMLEGNLRKQASMAETGPSGSAPNPEAQPPPSNPEVQPETPVKKELNQDEFFRSLGMPGLDQPILDGAFDSLDPFNPTF